MNEDNNVKFTPTQPLPNSPTLNNDNNTESKPNPFDSNSNDSNNIGQSQSFDIDTLYQEIEANERAKMKEQEKLLKDHFENKMQAYKQEMEQHLKKLNEKYELEKQEMINQFKDKLANIDTKISQTQSYTEPSNNPFRQQSSAQPVHWTKDPNLSDAQKGALFLNNLR